MPLDYKEWHYGCKKEWPMLAAESIKDKREEIEWLGNKLRLMEDNAFNLGLGHSEEIKKNKVACSRIRNAPW